MKPNTSPQGIAYGYVAANDLDPELVTDLLHGNGVHQYRDLSFEAAREQDEAEQRAEWEAACEQAAIEYQERGDRNLPFPEAPEFEFDDDRYPNGYEISEPEVRGIKDGVAYLSSWLGGALNFFIASSPFITTTAHRSSPCLPGAGILVHPTERDGNVTSYDVPPDWWDTEHHYISDKEEV